MPQTSARHRPRPERGAAAVEFALVVPILLLLVFGIIEFGYLINRSSMVNNAARDAAREASLSGDLAAIRAVANGSLDGMPGVAVDVDCEQADGSSCGAYDANRESGDTAVVTVTYVHEMITPVSMFFGDSIDVSRTARMRIE